MNIWTHLLSLKDEALGSEQVSSSCSLGVCVLVFVSPTGQGQQHDHHYFSHSHLVSSSVPNTLPQASAWSLPLCPQHPAHSQGHPWEMPSLNSCSKDPLFLLSDLSLFCSLHDNVSP